MPETLPTHTSPEKLKQLCRDLPRNDSILLSEVDTSLTATELRDTVEYGFHLNFLARAEEKQIKLSQYGLALSQGHLSYNDVREGFREGIKEYDLYKSLLYRIGSEVTQDEAGGVYLSGEKVSDALQFGFDIELTPSDIDKGSTVFLKTLEAGNLGRYQSPQADLSDRLAITEKYREFIQKISNEVEEGDDWADNWQETDYESQETNSGTTSTVDGPGIRISAIRVQNFKNIKDSEEVPISKITTLIGKNEAGKSSFLEAIATFDSTERYYDDQLCKFREKRPKNETPIVSLKFEIDDPMRALFNSTPSREIKETSFTITKFADGSYELHAGPTIQQSYTEYENHFTRLGEIAEDLSGKFDELFPKNNASDEQIEMANKLITRLAQNEVEPLNKTEVDQFIPEINRYLEELRPLASKSNSWDDIFDGIEEHINALQNVFYPALFNITYIDSYDIISDTVEIGRLDEDTNEAFVNLLSIGGTSPRDLQDKEGLQRQELLMDAAEEVSGLINEIWIQKQINFDLRGNDTIGLYVKDEEISDTAVDRHRVSISERSTGFRTFLSSLIQIIARGNDPSGRHLILFDDAAVHLHPSGKRDWLTAIEIFQKTIR